MDKDKSSKLELITGRVFAAPRDIVCKTPFRSPSPIAMPTC